MEYVFLRFPHLCEQIFSELENDCLTKCREVCRGWKPAIDNLSILMIQRYTKCSRTLLKTIIKKENLVNLAHQIRELYEKYPITSSKKRMTPLHEAAKVGNFPILELIIENHEDINCSDGYGWPLVHVYSPVKYCNVNYTYQPGLRSVNQSIVSFLVSALLLLV